jgi:predicted porin
MKKYLLAFSLLAVSNSLLAEVKLGESGVSANGSVELDLFGRTNTTGKDGKDTTTSAMEIATTINIDGKHESDIGNLIWRVATKLATDWRYDAFGWREAWAGVDTSYGKFIAGNQFSNMYLAMDWPYGAQGMGNLFGDLGAHEVQYSRAVSYWTPTFAGFTLSGQYDIGGYGENKALDPSNGFGNHYGEIEHSYAYEVVLNYNNNGLRADLGYYNGTNNGTLDYSADAFNGSRGKQASAVAGLHNNAQVYLAALKYNVGAFELALAYKYNLWDGEQNYKDGFIDTKMDNQDALIRFGYTFLEKNTIHLGYQMITETADNDFAYYSAMDAINFQYTRNIGASSVAFLQVRHHMFDRVDVPHMWVDGHQSTQDTATRFLIGYWVGF